MTGNESDRLKLQQYQEAQEAFSCISGMILFELARKGQTTRDIIIRNYIAKANKTSQSIFRLWEIDAFQDCWMLVRCLLERLFTILKLDERVEFELFETWSFWKQYEANNRINSDLEFRDKVEKKYLKLTEKQQRRIKDLEKNPPHWVRPDIEKMAKKMKMPFLYKYGYDYASTHIHPMADDGEQDFYNITKLEPKPDYPDNWVILSNTLLFSTMLTQAGLNASTLLWIRLVYDCLDNINRYISDSSIKYQTDLMKIYTLRMQNGNLCE